MLWVKAWTLAALTSYAQLPVLRKSIGERPSSKRQRKEDYSMWPH